MENKIIIPEVSETYLKELTEYLRTAKNMDFWAMLDMVSDWAQNYELAKKLSGLYGCKTQRELMENASRLESETYVESARFFKDGYTLVDFQHIFLEAYIAAMFELKINLRYCCHV